VHELRTREDAQALRGALQQRGGRLLVVGAGLIGMEVASSARRLGLAVTMLEAAPTPLGRVLPPALGAWIAERHRRAGVDVRLGRTVSNVRRSADVVCATLDDGARVEAETVLVAAGTAAATSWLGGWDGPGRPLFTDPLGRTSIASVYAAGDAACFPCALTGAHMPTPHWESAARQGLLVAHSILGAVPPATPPAMFWSDQHGSRIQFVGHAPCGSAIEIEGAEDLAGPFAAWISCAGRPAAAMLVDRPELLARARRWVMAADSASGTRDDTDKELAA
jgi:NADPH-dependent 2,4-dienoyl-CoA reductase/sulfur reductase-like enzyme